MNEIEFEKGVTVNEGLGLGQVNLSWTYRIDA
jgi:hypothetical protein